MITTKKKSIFSLLREVNEGRYAIPKLQREFVWDGRKAAKLLDSIYRGMPIGVIMIWETPKNHLLYLRRNYHVLPPFKDHHKHVWFLIDGQQRVSVIYHVNEGSTLENARGREVDFGRVVLSVQGEEDGQQQILYRKPVQELYVSLSDILHPHWRHRLAGLSMKSLRKVLDCRKRILKYDLHCMFTHMSLEDITECFKRINTQGMKLSTADAIITGAVEFDFRDLVHDVRQHLDSAFLDLPDMPILWSMATVHGVAEISGASVEQFLRKEEKHVEQNPRARKALVKGWTRLGKCFGKAVSYLHDNFKVLNRCYLYSDYMVAVLALFFFWNNRGPNAWQRKQINRWFWSTTVGSRYGGRNALSCLPDDARFFKSLAQGSRKRFEWSPRTDRVDLRKAQYAGRNGITAAVYSLLLMRGPVSIMDDGLNAIPIERFSTLANRNDRHHIFPRSLMASAGFDARRYNSICNICLLTAEEDQEIGKRRPSSYLAEPSGRMGLFRRKMARHLIPCDKDSGLWDRTVGKGFRRFIRARESFLFRELERAAGMRLFRREEH